MDSIISAAINYLFEHHLSEKELRERLVADFKGLPDREASIEPALARLKELQVINDFRLAESVIYRFSNKGNYFIKKTLEQKGVNEEMIAKALSRMGDETERGLDEAYKKWKQMPDNRDEKARVVLCRFLNGRGFTPTSIYTVLHQMTRDGCFTQQKRKKAAYAANKFAGECRKVHTSSCYQL